MQSPIQLIVGLGNPGASYEKTRHNAGAWFVEALCKQFGITLRPDTKFQGLYGRCQLQDKDCHLLIPTTYMNKCAKAIKALASFYRIEPAAMLIAHDELDLPPGVARLKFDGGAGGHNGLKDTIAHFGKQFYRLRLGIGHPGHSDQVSDYVLSRPTRQERELIMEAITQATDVLPLVIDGELQRAMHKLHSLDKE